MNKKKKYASGGGITSNKKSLPSYNLSSPVDAYNENLYRTVSGYTNPTNANPGGGSSNNFDPTGFLQFAPDIMNFATGVFGKNDTPQATQINQRSVGMMPEEVNINPQLEEMRKGYRAIIADPNATMNQKLAAQSQLNQASSQLYAQKQNREAQMQAEKASIQASLDRSQSRYDAQARQDNMAADANLGLSGNFARQALSSISSKALQQKAVEAKKNRDKQTFGAIISSLPQAAQKRLMKWYDI